MGNNFAIKTEWIQNQDNIDIEDLATDITITFCERNLTDNYDTIDGLRKTSVALVPYPLAWWIVSNWWRLRWEPTPLVPSTDWRMSHFLPAIGDGYCWPSIGFQTDGEIIRITSLPTTGEDGASVIYHTLFSELISARLFEKSIESFINECNNKYFDSNISQLWNFIQDERKDKEATIFRIIEAKLGFNIDEGPEEEINKIIEKAKYFGEKSTQELSVLLYKESIVEKEIDGLKNHNIGTDIFIENLYEMRKYAKQNENKFLPWEYGYALAHEFRRSYGIESVLSTEQMCKIIGTSKEKLYINSQKNSDFALGVSFGRNQYSVILNKKYPTAIRFMTARMLCDAIIAEADDNVLPATSSKTARQKIQRAFAAELLCPIELIEDRLDNNYTNEDMWNDIAEEFEVTTLLVKSQLANHSLIQQFDNANIWFDSIQIATPAYAINDFI